ncbi:4-(cytidine 5'-diphospho)-2-C-methyl-D-erythritol kinase [Luteimonas sp. A478]
MGGPDGDGWSRWPAPAKLNLFLRITGRRGDGYHCLQTAFRLLDWGDTVFLRPRPDGLVRMHGPGLAGVPDDSNLLLRAARMLQQASGTGQGADIAVDKRIPMGGGFGGGSSNAATVLMVLNRLWNTRMDTPGLAALGLQLGADVPVFVRGHSAWAEGVGERLTPLELPPAWYLLVDPGVRVGTAELFQTPELTRNAQPATIADFVSGAPLGNAFEPVLRRREPVIDSVFAELARVGSPRLTGTGSGCFVEFATCEAAEAARAALPAGLRAWVAEGMARSTLYQALENTVPQGRRQEVQGTGF